MEERLGLHTEAMGLLDAVVQHVTDDDLERPTLGWTVADLLAHEVGQHLGFAAAVRPARPRSRRTCRCPSALRPGATRSRRS